jgi:CRISPR type III-A-associated RAMP protein Csm5
MKPFNSKVTLEIITPIHIGNGEDYWPYDYVIVENKIKIIDKNIFLN